jgi:hypothetical protein
MKCGDEQATAYEHHHSRCIGEDSASLLQSAMYVQDIGPIPTLVDTVVAADDVMSAANKLE